MPATPLLAQERPAIPDSTPSQLRFDVVSIKENTGRDFSIRSEAQSPDTFRQANLPLRYYVTYAFDVPQPSRLAGIPDWANTTRYDIVGKASRTLSEDDRRAMLRHVLVTRFGLRTHVESQQQMVYVMTAARADKRLGPGMTPRPDCATEKCDGGGTGRPDGVEVRAITIAGFANLLSLLLRQVVVDETGIDGAFDINASWRRERAADDPNDTRPSMFTALQEQLGLKLEPLRRAVDVLVVDSLTRPTPD
jgi:uncharacterized protein (TIGR03435 family)